jgi:phospholipid/cholesterol/gamma-HCH transport system ATP-binding protein
LTIFMITHDLDSLYAVCDRVAVIADKTIVAAAPIRELEQSEQPWIREYFLGPRGRAAAAAAARAAGPEPGSAGRSVGPPVVAPSLSIGEA